jgi:hypothetical protein
MARVYAKIRADALLADGSAISQIVGADRSAAIEH